MKHGKWLPQMRRGAAVWACSECEGIGRPIFEYCPHCGARMYGKEDEE